VVSCEESQPQKRGSPALKNRKTERYWLIQGDDSSRIIFEAKVGVGQFTDEQMCQLLRALAAKAGLTLSEIIGAYATRRTNIANDLLEVNKDYIHHTFSCGVGPTFSATVVDADGKPLRPFKPD
jgi:hypothetical protein